MDDCIDASKSDSSSVEEWLDLTKSDYAKVIFSNLYWSPDNGDVECVFTLTETVQENPLDYVGLYKIGYEDLSQCLVSKTLNELKLDEDAKSFHCVFKSDNMPELNGFYQFLYITHDKEVCGASMPFEVRHSKNKADFSDEEIVTEKIENDFLMVRHGLEQKNHQLETVVNVCRNENSALISKLNALKKEKDVISQELEITKQRLMLSSALDEIKSLMKDNETFTEELRLLKVKNKAILSDFETKKKENEIITNELETVKTENNNFIAELEVLKTDSDRLFKEFEAVSKERDDLNSQIEKIKNCIVTEFKILKGESYCCSTEQKEVDLNMVFKASRQKYEDISDELNKCKTLLAECTTKLEQKESELRRMTEEILHLQGDRQNDRLLIENENRRLKSELQKMEKYIFKNSNYPHYASAKENWDIIQQLDDAHCMIKALEDSKELVKEEMCQVTEQLNKTKEELCRTKCENIALKVTLDDMAAMKLNEEQKQNSIKQLNDKLLLQQQEIELLRLNQEQKQNQVRKLSDKLLRQEVELLQQQEEINKLKQNLIEEQNKSDREVGLKQTKEELCRIKCENTALKVSLDDMAARTIMEDCAMKNDAIEKLENKVKILEQNEAAAKEDAKDKTARLLDAAERYKDLFIVNRKLTKQLLKFTSEKSQSSSAETYSGTTSEKFSSPICVEASKESTNSDSDTGEHLSKQTVLQVLGDNLCGKVSTLPKETLKLSEKNDQLNHTQESSSLDNVVRGEDMSYDSRVLLAEINRLNWLKFKNSSISRHNSEINKCLSETEVKKEPIVVRQIQAAQKSSPETFDVPCAICEKLFTVSSLPDSSLMQHYEVEHKMDMCPVCGQLFDKIVPPKYLTYHVNKHFD